MADSNQIRINELARELEVKAKVLIDFLPEIGVTEKKTHSSSLDLDNAELARKHFAGLAAKEAAAEAEKQAKATAAKRPAARPTVTAAPTHLRLSRCSGAVRLLLLLLRLRRSPRAPSAIPGSPGDASCSRAHPHLRLRPAAAPECSSSGTSDFSSTCRCEACELLPQLPRLRLQQEAWSSGHLRRVRGAPLLLPHPVPGAPAA